MESLEDRRLLATTPFTPGQQQAWSDGADALEAFAERLQEAPRIGVAVPLTDTAIGQAAELKGLLSNVLTDPVQSYLATQAAPDQDGIVATLSTALTAARSDGLLIVNPAVQDASTSDQIAVAVSFEILAEANASFDLTTALTAGPFQVGGLFAAELAVSYQFDAVLGLVSSGGTTPDQFFVRFADDNRLQATIDFQQQAGDAWEARFGLLGLTVEQAAVDLDYGVELAFSDDRLSSSELRFGSLESFVTAAPITGQNGFQLTLPITTNLAGVSLPSDATVRITDADLFDGIFDPFAEASFQNDADTFADFQNLAADELLGGFQQVETWFTGLGTSNAFADELPFTETSRLAEVLRLGTPIAARLVDPLLSSAGDGTANFETVQQLATRLGEAVRFSDDVQHGPTLILDVDWTHVQEVIQQPLAFDFQLPELNQIRLTGSSDLGIEVDVAARFELGVQLRRPGADFRFTAATLLSSLNRGQGVETVSGDDLQVTLRNGQSFGVNLSGLTTVGQVVTAVEGAGPAGAVEVLIDEDAKRLIIVDATGGNGTLRIERFGQSLAAFGLGIAGQEASGRIEGAPLHGETIADLIFVRELDRPAIKATTRLIGDRFDAQARIGFVDVGVIDGSILAQLTSTIAVADLGTPGQYDQEISLRDAFSAVSESLVRPDISGSAAIDLPLAVSFASSSLPNTARVSGVSLPASPRLSLTIPNLTLPDLSAPGAVRFDLTQLGGLASLRTLDFQDVVAGLRGSVDYLQQLSQLSEVNILNGNVGLLGITLSDIVDFAATFERVVAAVEQAAETGLGDLDELLEDVLGLPEDVTGSDPQVPDFAVFTIPELNAGKTFTVNGNLIDLADRQADIPELTGGQFASLEDLLRALQRDSADIQVSLDTQAGRKALRIDVTQQLGDFRQAAPLDLDLASLNIPGLTKLVDLASQSNVDVAVNGSLHVSLGLDMTNPSLIRPFLYDASDDGTGTLRGTRVELTASVDADETLNLTAAAGPLGVKIENGSLSLTNRTGTGPARIAVSLNDNDQNGRHYLQEFLGGGAQAGLDISDLQIDVDGRASATLPVSFPGLPVPQQTLTVSLTDLNVPSSLEVTGGDAFEAAYDTLSGDFDLLAMVGGWEGAFDLLIDAMNGQLFGLDLPLIGDSLRAEARFLQEIRAAVSDNLQGNASSGQNGFGDVQQAIFDALGPGGIGLLKDINSPQGNLVPDGSITVHDVFTTPDPSGNGRYFQITVGSDPVSLDLPVDFALGVPGLALDIDAPINVALGFEWTLGMGVNLTDGFYLDTSDPSELEVFLDVTAPGLNAAGELGFLRLQATDRPTAQAVIGANGPLPSRMELTANRAGDEEANVAVVFLNDPTLGSGNESVEYDAAAKELRFRVRSGQTRAIDLVTAVNGDSEVSQVFTATLPFGGSGQGFISVHQSVQTVANLPSRFQGRFEVDLIDPAGPTDNGRLSLAEMLAVESYEDVLQVTADAAASVDLHFLADFGPGSAFPKIRTDFALDWDYSLGSGTASPTVTFENVELNLGDFFREFAGEALAQVQETLDPLRPVLDTLQGPVPVISELMGGDLTYLDLARLFGGRFEQAADFFAAAATVVETIDGIPDLTTDVWVSFGDADWDFAGGGLVPQGNAAPTLDQVLSATSQLAGFDATRYFQPMGAPDPQGLVMSFPLLSDPSRIFGLLSGQDADLFALELPTFVYDVSFSQFFPIPAFPIVGAQVSASIGAQVDLAFGFDTAGLQQFRASGNPLDVFNGFYVFDHENADGSGADISELVFQANVTAGVGLNAGLVRASVDGGLFGRIDFNLHDNNDDGRVRTVELLDNTLLGPIHVFDVSGALDARLIASADVGLPPAAVHFQADIVPPFRVLDFQIPRPTNEAVPLAQMNGSLLELNMGPLAFRRNFFFTQDVAESYVLRPGQSPGSVIVEAFGRSQLYQGVTAIVGNAGLGDDRIEVAREMTIPVYLSGGEGDDVLIGGGGDDRLSGDAGNDQLEGNQGADTLDGNDGNDVLRGGEGADVISGGSGLDTLFGGDGDDEIRGDADRDQMYGEAGDDRMFGGTGDDLLEGGTGSDHLEGGLGNDRIEGGKDSDVIWGDAGDDQLSGGDGSDEIHGGAGNDFVTGGVGNDEIHGDDGDDSLLGDNSRDTIYGGRGDDRLFGGLAEDMLFGGLGNDEIYASDELLTSDATSHTIHGGGGADLIYASDGDDVVYGDGINDAAGNQDPREDGADAIHGLAGNDQIFGGGGNDEIWAGSGNDYVSGDLGSDQLHGGEGDDVLWGGFAAIALARLDRSNSSAVAANFTLPPRWEEVQGRAVTATTYLPTQLITPAALNGLSSDGSPGDGQDTLQGDAGSDLLFGGSEADALDGGDGPDYVDAGLGNDLDVTGGRGDDVVRGGGGNDAVRGGEGIDQVYGDAGDDLLFGDAGQGQNQIGQRLFGGDGRDVLFAYAPTGTAEDAIGDQLLGDAGGDILYGNVRQDVLLGGEGNDLLSGDYLAGPLYVPNASEINGGDDQLLGDAGEDRLVGDGGDDQLWGGAGTDVLDGAAGADMAFGGSGIDLFVLYTGPGAADDTLDGHGANAPEDAAGNVTPDDNATDILVINGTGLDDTILLSETCTPERRLRIDVNSTPYFVDWRNPSNGVPLVEQFQLNGFGGNDNLGFAQTLPLPGMNRDGSPTFVPPGGCSQADASPEVDLSYLNARGRDFVAVINGGDGNDRLVGSSGRDRLDGNAGNDRLFGLGGDDRLWGDGGEGSRFDHDELFAGGGNDDLLGGQGRNDLYAWSFYPDLAAQDPMNVVANGPGDDFGVYLDDDGRPVASPLSGGIKLEDTGLNRIVGQLRNDYLLGGTGVDFMYGGGGNDTLLRRDGQTFESLDEDLAGDTWKQYAKDTGHVWYVGGSNADDRINVDFVTEPGLLADHHLITRLTDNNGTFSFAASVRLDFAATDANGNRLWDVDDLVFRANEYVAAKQLDPNGSQAATSMALTSLTNGLLPPEDEYLAIIIDALDGDDEITVGPTVQKTVWIDAGPGDDRVEIVSGNAILIDRAEIGTPQGGFRGRNDTPERAFDLDIEGPNRDGLILTNLTIDNPNDTDWFRFTPQTGLSQATFGVVGNSPDDNLLISIHTPNGSDDPPSVSGLEPSAGPLDLSSLVVGETYLLRVQSDLRPTIYDLKFQRGFAGPLPISNMALRDDPIRRDVILGGTGNDILIGGPGEDWIFGGPRNVDAGVEDRDVISGGFDRQASDLLFGGADDDSFQILPDFLPQLSNQRGTLFDPTGQTYIPTTSDQFFGGTGDDQVIFAGGDLDRDGRVVPDFVALRYNSGLHRYEFTNLVWDVHQLAFATEETDNGSEVYQQQYLFYQTRDIERTVITTAKGDDVVHLDGTFKLLPISGSVNAADIDTWGIDPGDAQQFSSTMTFTVQAGDGNDRVFGSPLADALSGGAGNDQLVGGGGDDKIDGGGGNDQLYGGTTALVDGSPTPGIWNPEDPDSDLFRFEAAPPLLITPPPGRLGIDLQRTPDAFIDQAAAFEGSLANEGLEAAQSIGDFNGDGRDDLLLSGQSFSYVILSSADLKEVVAVRDRAQFVVDHAALGRPAVQMGNINGDAFSDLIFQRETAGSLFITVVLGGPNAGVNAQGHLIDWPRQWDDQFASTVLSDGNHYEIQLPLGQISAADVRTYALHYLGDVSTAGIAHDDLLVASSTPAGLSSDTFGYVFSGRVLADPASDPVDGAEDAYATLITTTPGPPSSQDDFREEDLQLVVAGDTTGNGRDDILVYDARRQQAALIEGGTSGNVGVDAQSAVVGPLVGNLVRPVAVGDLNQDGLDELALASAQDVRIYFGSPQPAAISLANPGVTVSAPADHPGSTTLSVTGGDFDGDGRGDLAIDVGVTRLPDAGDDPQTHVYFGIADKSPQLQFSDADATLSVPDGGLPIARALQFDGVASVLVNDDASIVLQSQVTIEAWIRVDQLDTNLHAIVQKGNGDLSANHAYALYVDRDGSLVADTSDGPTGNRVKSATDVIEPGRGIMSLRSSIGTRRFNAFGCSSMVARRQCQRADRSLGATWCSIRPIRW